MNSADSPLILYSANSWLSYAIAERFYRGEHYVWCTPHFSPISQGTQSYKVPPSSSPIDIYRGLREDVSRADHHSAKIAANKAGMLNGVQQKRASGVIVESEAADIASMLDNAETSDFSPILFLIPFAGVADLIHEVPVAQRAHPLSVEFIVESLPRDLFDVIGGV